MAFSKSLYTLVFLALGVGATVSAQQPDIQRATVSLSSSANMMPIDRKKTALVIIDPQTDYLSFIDEIDGTTDTDLEEHGFGQNLGNLFQAAAEVASTEDIVERVRRGA